MDYEKEYKKLKAGIKNAYLYAQTNSTKAVLEHILPELRESEDERVRNEIIAFVEQAIHRGGGTPIPQEQEDSWIAWLEKQRESQNEVRYWTEEEIEPIISDFLRGAEHYGGMIARLRYLKPKSLEAAKEEKVDNQNCVKDNYKPKFHEGDWISGYYANYRVTAINSKGYVVEDTDGNKINILFENEKFHHLWSIQDAKDGDVLSYVTDEEDLWIMIYLSLYEPYEGHVHYHALLVNDSFTDKGTCCICINDLKPATKEQCDTLFTKMKEACYKWDAEKKELKKIKLQPSQWNISDFRTWQHIVCDILTKYWGIGQYLDDGFCKKIAQDMQEEWNKKLCLIQDSAWSEEDEKMLDNCINALGDSSFANTYEIEEWLKSLRQRIGG